MAKRGLFYGLSFLLAITMAFLVSACAKRVCVSEEEAKAPEAVTAKPAETVAPKPMAEEAMPTTGAPKEEVLTMAESRTSAGLLPVYFDFDKYNIRGDQPPTLDRNANWMKKNPAARIRIEGNCDERGSNEYNLALGERRANSAKDYLTNMGIAPERIETLSYGEERPLCPEHDEECWTKNRRADFATIGK
ncbi:MAG: peptidoglycan-associated lipoprotein Pal [Thermodesulfobacteriota bacterium]|nr:peptidoglycan-associated lipoprotein Pal [Thermodesulfobacteriota bacterium]